MSFILDALRKSEIDRQREAPPGLMRSPMANVRRETPVWSWLLIGLLTLALFGIGTAWWLLGPGQTQSTGTAGETEALEPAEPLSSATSAAPAPSVAAGETRAPQMESPATDGTALTGEPRPITELIRSDPGLPRYTLSFLEYNSADPDASSALINGRRYYSGQSIDGGPELAQFRADGVVLAWRGQIYLLTAR
jgi:hypothetical protein